MDVTTALKEALNDLLPFFAVPVAIILLKFGIDVVIAFVGGNVTVSGSTSNKREKKKKHKMKIRPNECGEFDYNYSSNNYECEGCK